VLWPRIAERFPANALATDVFDVEFCVVVDAFDIKTASL
jgi:hypothetical protein